MKPTFLYFALILLFATTTVTRAQTTDRPRTAEWNNLIFGGRFMDRFLPIPNQQQLTRDTWGADNVLPRFIDNGIENRKWSFWGATLN